MAAFTDSQISDLCTILEVGSDVLGDRLTYYADLITDADKTKVVALIADWETAGAKFTSIVAKESNLGAQFDPNAQKQQLKRQIAALIYAQDLLMSGAVSRLGRA